MLRRHLLRALSSAALVAAATLALSCSREPRCKHCGMRIDPASAWRTDLVDPGGGVTSFDTPRCALSSWRSGATAARTIIVQEYYERRAREGQDVVFVIGGDVVGPMGADLVPVDPARAVKFIQDHRADRSLSLAEVTPQVLAAIGAK